MIQQTVSIILIFYSLPIFVFPMFRNKIAGGSINGFCSATRMATMVIIDTQELIHQKMKTPGSWQVALRILISNFAFRFQSQQWSDELAYLATLNVLQCTMKHDSCRNTCKLLELFDFHFYVKIGLDSLAAMNFWQLQTCSY